MPIRAVIIMFVVAVVMAICYRDPIYKWFKENLSKNQPEEENTDNKSEGEKENHE